MKITNNTRQTVIASRAELADTPKARLVGLLNRTQITDGEGLVITQCRSIHMVFMRFPIDVIFADRNLRVVGMVENIRPFRLSPYFWRAYYAIEVPPGVVASSQTQKGDALVFLGPEGCSCAP